MIYLPHPQLLDFNINSRFDQSVSSIEFLFDSADRISSLAKKLLGAGARKLVIGKDANLRKHDEYRIDFLSDKIMVAAGVDSGIFCAITTLKQMQRGKGFPAQGVIHDWADTEMRIQHVDLKRIGWDFDYLLELVEMFADLKINYILMEYEDKFKFDFCNDIPAESAFTKEQIATLEKKAFDNFIEIIPLVQCIGHFEYILKHEKYLDISESPQIRSQACPLNPKAIELFRKMASEVIDAHPSSKFFHVGADEPFLLGTCPKCKAEADRVGKGKLYGDFLNNILSWVIDEKGKTPLFWADILEHYNDAAEICRKDSIAVEWNYQPLSSRSNSVKFYQSSTGRIDKDIYRNELTGEQHCSFDKYLKYDPKNEDFSSLPFGAYLKDLGFEVITASNVKFVDNIKTHSEAVKEDGLLGNLATYWASANTDRPPYAIFETRLQGVCMLAASAWNLEHEKEHRNTFFSRVAEYFECDEKLSPIYDILNNSGHLIVPGDNNRNDLEYFEKVSHVIDNASLAKGRHLTVLEDFIEKIQLEKELDVFKKETLTEALLPETAYKKLDLLPYCNERFANTEEVPGWSRIFQNDLRFFPKGDVCFNGTPFRVIQDAPDGSKSVIMIGDNDPTPFFPRSVEGIEAGTKAYALNFLHGHIEGKALSDGHYGKYILNYADGEREEVPLLYTKNMGEWWRIVEMEDASIAWAGDNLKKANVGLHLYTYFPRRPESEIASIDFVCESKTALALAAVTAITKVPTASESKVELVENIKVLQSRFLELKKRMETDLKHFLSEDGVDEIIRIAFLFTSKYLLRLLKSINR